MQQRDIANPPRVGAALGAVLKHAAGLLLRGHELFAFPDAPGGRLLNVHVLARLHRPDAGKRVPVVGRGDGNGVDAVVGKHVAHVDESLDFLAALLLDVP